jgi:hypothetical protein
MNLEKGLPHLLSWENGFALGRIVKLTPRYLKLGLRFHSERVNGRLWSIWCHRMIGDEQGPGEFLWRRDLRARTETAARMVLAQVSDLILHRREQARQKMGSRVQGDLTESQLGFLGKQYPQTIALFRAAARQAGIEGNPSMREESGRAFVEETYACSKILLEPIVDRERLLRMRKMVARMARRKRKPDPVEYELIAGCYPKGYCSMNLPQLRQAVGMAVGYMPTIEALRKKWSRLKLPLQRRRGRPKKEP